jgi:hypothetical protein
LVGQRIFVTPPGYRNEKRKIHFGWPEKFINRNSFEWTDMAADFPEAVDRSVQPARVHGTLSAI